MGIAEVKRLQNSFVVYLQQIIEKKSNGILRNESCKKGLYMGHKAASRNTSNLSIFLNAKMQ